MDVKIYIKRTDADGYLPLDLFKDEKVEINLSVKNLSDISKIRSDFTQSFTIPCSPQNNKLFEYWYSAEVDGTFNANIRVDAYIEVNGTPFRYGSIQLDNGKLKNGSANSYSITFFGNGVNLSDKFGDDYLKDLDLSAYNHEYSSSILVALLDGHINSGDIYYPFISATSFFEYGTGGSKDLLNASNTADYRDFKPAIRLIKLIEAIEAKYNVTFSRNFFDRAIFYNLFMWLHKDSGRMKTSSDALGIDYTSLTSESYDWTIPTHEMNLTTDSLRVNWDTGFPTGYENSGNRKIYIYLKVNTTSLFNYKIEVFDNGILYDTIDNLNGVTTTTIFNKSVTEDNETNHLFTFRISSIQGAINFTSEIQYRALLLIPTYPKRYFKALSTSQTTANAIVKISEQIPEMKVKDFFVSLVNQFNLILKPTSANGYEVDTLDNWYARGKAYDISNLIDIKDITVNKPKAKKRIDFLYQKTDTILGKQYFNNNQIGYGDLRATYDIQGEEMKIESQFENLVFERLVDKSLSTPAPTDLNAGYSIDVNLNPTKGKPFIFYRNGVDYVGDIKIQPSYSYDYTWHTATDDNRVFEQVTSAINFGADISTWFYAPIDTGLYYNFWKTYIEDLFSKKTRVLSLKAKIPIRILHNLGLNDRFIVGDKKYKISSLKVDLTTADADLELFSDLGSPIDSYNSTIPLTIDSTAYTIDSELLTIDADHIHLPVTSYTINGVSMTEYNASFGEEYFEVKIDANTNWTCTPSASWITVNKSTGNRSEYIRVKVAYRSTGSARTGTLNITIGSDTFTITINQA